MRELCVRRDDDAPAERLLRRLTGVFTAGSVFRDVVLSYLRELGERWECGEASIAQEHFASCFLEHWMLGCARRPRRSADRRAVLACLPGEHHSPGLTAFGVVLQDLGWSITFLGRDTPVAAVKSAADAVRADAIVLAAVMPEPRLLPRDIVGAARALTLASPQAALAPAAVGALSESRGPT